MGCGASKAALDVSNKPRPAAPSQIPQADPKTDLSNDIFVGVSPQQPLLCRDEFNSKYTNELMYRWRPAQIVQIDGDSRNKILVHYDGWADSFDHWVDLRSDVLTVCPVGLLPAEQIKKGTPLTAEQHKIATDHFRQGKEFVHTSDEQPREPEIEVTEPIAEVNQDSEQAAVQPQIEDEDVLTRPLRKLPPVPVVNVPPPPVIATRRNLTVNPAEASHSSSTGSSPGKMVVPAGAVLPTPLVPPTAVSSILRRPSLPQSQNPTQPAEPPAPTPENPYCVNDMVDCLDIFYKKGATVPSQKWRPAEIIEVVGDYVTIHFLNWDSKYDERLHHVNDSHRLCSFGNKTTRTVGSGGSVVSAASSAVYPRRHSGSSAAPHPPPANVTVVAQLPPKAPKDSDGSEIDSNGAKPGTTTSVPESAQKTAPKAGIAGQSDAADGAGLTEEQFSFTRNFLNYRKKKLADKVAPTAPASGSTADTAPSATASKKSAPADKAADGGFMKQFTSLFGAREAIVAVPSPSPVASPGEESEPGVTTAEVVPAAGEDERDEEEIARREHEFLEKLESKGLHVFAIEGDGNCLFRAVSHQLYLQQDMHDELRACCVEHLIRHRKRYEVFCEGDFDDYIKEMSKSGVWGDDLEIRALEEITDRVITIYSSSAENVLEPINNNFEEKNLLAGVPPLTLSYHGNSHYNSIYDERYPLPLVQRKSRLLLRSRTALNKQDILQSNANTSDNANGSANGNARTSESSTSDPTAQWRQSGYASNNSNNSSNNRYGQPPQNAYGQPQHMRTPSYEAAQHQLQQQGYAYPRGYPPPQQQQQQQQQLHNPYMHAQYQSGGYGTPSSAYGTPPGSYQPASAMLAHPQQLLYGYGLGSQSSDQSDEADASHYGAGGHSPQQGYRYQPQSEYTQRGY